MNNRLDRLNHSKKKVCTTEGGDIYMKDVIDAILEHVEPEWIEKIYFFGSAVTNPKGIVHKKIIHWFWCSYEEKSDPVYANDLDVLVLTNKDKTIDKTTSIPASHSQFMGGYDFSYIEEEDAGRIHLQITPEKRFKKALKNDEKDARRILLTSKLIYER